VPPPERLALQSQPVLNILETPTTQGTDGIYVMNSTTTSAVWDLTLDARPRLDFALTNPYLSPNANSNTSRDWYTRGRTPGEPNIPTASMPGIGAGGAQGQELERKPPSNAYYSRATPAVLPWLSSGAQYSAA